MSGNQINTPSNASTAMVANDQMNIIRPVTQTCGFPFVAPTALHELLI